MPSKVNQLAQTSTSEGGRCSNLKVRRISEWVDSVDHSYEPSEQGTCITSPARSIESENFEFFSFDADFLLPSDQKQNQRRQPHTKQPVNRSRKGAKGSINFKPNTVNPSPPGHKNSFTNGASASTREQKNDCRTNFHTPFSPSLDESTSAEGNSNKRDTGQKVAREMEYQKQSTEGIQLGSQNSYHCHDNNHYDNQNVEHVSVEDDMAMEIDNCEELEVQIRAEVNMVWNVWFLLDTTPFTLRGSRGF